MLGPPGGINVVQPFVHPAPLFAVRKKWLLFYPVFILGTLNRETTCFLGVIYLVTAFGREKPGKIVLHVLVLAAIWLTIKGCLSRIFAQNPGSLFLFLLVDNFQYLSRPGNVLSVLSSFGFLWILVLLCFRRIFDRFIRRSQVVALPFFVGMLLVGALVEIRVFGELIPLVLAAVLLILKGFSKAASNQETRRITGPPLTRSAGLESSIEGPQGSNPARVAGKGRPGQGWPALSQLHLFRNR